MGLNISCDSLRENKPYGYATEAINNSKHENEVQFHKTMNALSISVCVLGVIANLITLVVFSRRSLSSPINTILKGAAISNIIYLFSYIQIIVDASYFLNGYDGPLHDTLENISFFISHLKIIFDAITGWLTVAVGVWIYAASHKSLLSTQIRNLVKARLAVIITYCVCFAVYFPAFFNIGCKAMQNYNFLVLHSILKILPCLIIFVLTICLTVTLFKIKNKRYHGKHKCGTSCKRITRMILVVVMFYLITHIPQEVTDLLPLFEDGYDVHQNKPNVKEIMDLLELLNGAVGLLIYSTMNKKFRNSWIRIFCPRCTQSSAVTKCKFEEPIVQRKWPIGCIIYI